jgi:tryptophanyl-tRNA synthetase
VPHIGNYFGAIKPWVELQQRIAENNKNSRAEPQNPLIISIVDLHAITLPKEPKILK